MIIKSYEVKKNKPILPKNNFYLLYGENNGLKKDIRESIKIKIKAKLDYSKTSQEFSYPYIFTAKVSSCCRISSSASAHPRESDNTLGQKMYGNENSWKLLAISI